MRKMPIYLCLALVCFVASGLRIFRLGESPPSVNWDEASLGYNAYSLLKTGADEYGRKLPLSLRSFDDYKPAVYAYFVVPILTFLPLSDTAVRLPSAVLGTLLPLVIFVLAFRLSRSPVVAILASLLVAIEPWAMHFSRIAFEANIANVLLYIGLALLISNNLWGVLFTIISTYTYHSERAIVIPLLLLFYLQFRPKVSAKIVILIPFLLLPLLISSLREPITARLSSTNILKLWPFVPKEFSSIIYNPIYTLTWQLSGQFLAYFSPANLFIRGSQEPGQYVPTLGLFYIIEFPFWVWGLYKLRSYPKLNKLAQIVFLLAPLPAVITWNWFSVIRTLPLYPMFTITIAVGLDKLGSSRFLALPLLLISTIYLTNTEILFAPYITEGEYQPGFEKAIPFLLSQAENYDHVIIDSPHIAPYIFLLFYGQYNPALYHQQVPTRIKNSGTESLPFGKFVFREVNWPVDRNLPNTLFMGPTNRLPDYEFENEHAVRLLGDIYDKHGYISFRVVGND